MDEGLLKGKGVGEVVKDLITKGDEGGLCTLEGDALLKGPYLPSTQLTCATNLHAGKGKSTRMDPAMVSLKETLRVDANQIMDSNPATSSVKVKQQLDGNVQMYEGGFDAVGFGHISHFLSQASAHHLVGAHKFGDLAPNTRNRVIETSRIANSTVEALSNCSFLHKLAHAASRTFFSKSFSISPHVEMRVSMANDSSEGGWGKGSTLHEVS